MLSQFILLQHSLKRFSMELNCVGTSVTNLITLLLLLLHEQLYKLFYLQLFIVFNRMAKKKNILYFIAFSMRATKFCIHICIFEQSCT